MGILRTLFDALSAMSLLVVVATVAAEPQPRGDPPNEPMPVVDRPRVGYTPPPPMPAPEPEVVQRTPPPQITPPYVREPEPAPPQCTPTRSALMQYWRQDLVRARSLSRVAGDEKCRNVLGDAYGPLMTAIQNGANGGNNTPEVPEAYAKVVIARHTGTVCVNGVCTSGNGFLPTPGERR
jgi:hypothetical protein